MVTERSQRTLHDVVSEIGEKQCSPVQKEAELLYYIVQLLHSLWFMRTKNYVYLALDSPKQVQVFADSSVKLHDFSSSLHIMSEVGSENDLKARGIQYTKLERLFNYCIKVFGPCPFLHRLIEDLKAQD